MSNLKNTNIYGILFLHEICFRKPNLEAYEYVLNAEGLNPTETLFIDDLERNVICARQTGMLAYNPFKGRQTA